MKNPPEPTLRGDGTGARAPDGVHVRLGSRRIRLPGSRPGRIAIGGVLILGGLLGFLPIVGFWMLPLGLMVLAVDLPMVRGFRRRLEVAIGRWQARRRQRTPGT